MQIILLESDDSLRSLLKLNIMKSIGCDVIEKSSAMDAISLLQILPDVDLVICRDDAKLIKAGHEIAAYFEQANVTTPILFIGQKQSSYKFMTAIDPSLSWKKVISEAGKILGIAVSDSDTRMTADYVPVGINYFFNITSTSMGCDVFIRVKKGDEFQYIKRLHSNDSFTREDIEKYRDGGLKEFYIMKEHFSRFVDFVTAELVFKLDDPAIKGEDRIRLTAEAYEVTQERIHSLGIDDNTVELVQESIKSMESSLKESNTLATFLLALRKNKLSYAYSHTYLCSIILHKVIKEFDWNSPQIKDKLTFVAYFHDISLNDNRLLQISTMAECETLSETEKKRVLSHAADSALIVERFPNVPNGIASILREHHGSKNGMGFPDSLSISIAPLSMMFIVVEHFVDEFLRVNSAPTVEDFERIFTKMEERFNKATYLQTLQALQKMTNFKRPE